jgi:putative DNA primase/helicase
MSQKGFTKDRVAAGVRYLHVMLKNVPEAPRRRADEPPHAADDDMAPV